MRLAKPHAGLRLQSKLDGQIPIREGAGGARRGIKGSGRNGSSTTDKSTLFLKPQTWNVPSDDDHRPNQHSSDGNQAHALLMVSRLGQLWPNEIQKPRHAQGRAPGAALKGSLPSSRAQRVCTRSAPSHPSTPCLGNRKGLWYWGQSIQTELFLDLFPSLNHNLYLPANLSTISGNAGKVCSLGTWWK